MNRFSEGMRWGSRPFLEVWQYLAFNINFVNLYLVAKILYIFNGDENAVLAILHDLTLCVAIFNIL